MKNKLLNAFVIALILFQAVAPIGALAYTGTDQADYAPGSVVTIFGDNSDGAGYLPGETVHVDVVGPNGYTAACDASVNDDPNANGAWSCQVILWAGSEAVGDYSYTATGLISGVSQSGSFTDANVNTTTTLNSISSPLTLSQAGVSYSGQVSASPVVPNGQTVKLQVASGGCAGTFADITTSTTTNGNGSFSGTFTAPSIAGTYGFRVQFPSTGNVPGFSDRWQQSHSNCQTVTVQSANTAPVADDDSYTTPEDTPLIGNVLSNDTDADGNTLTATKVSDPAHGSLIFNADGSFTYTPAGNYSGSDSFTYKVNDGTVDSNIATVSITVTAVNDAPVAANDAYGTAEDTPLTIAAPGVLSNDSDVDGGALAAIKVTDPTNGTVTLNTDGSFAYTPNTNFNGTDNFTYKANDTFADSNVATVTITVSPVNDVPVAANDTFTTNEDLSLSSNVMGNDSDADNNSLTAIKLTDPSHGSLTFNADGSFTYTPAANYFGTDSFTYKVNDGSVDSNDATVSISVNGVNDAPVAVADAYTTAEDMSLTIAVPGVLGNDSDVEGSSLTAELVAGPLNGVLGLQADGSFTYTPNANFNGTDSFTYQANDGSALSNAVTVTITVTPVNDAPVAVDDDYATNEDTPLTIAALGVLGNDTDVDGDVLTTTKVTDPSHGTVTVNADGSFTYTPSANYFGSDSFTYKVSDGSLESVATVTLTVNAVNDAPVAADDTFSTDEDTSLTDKVLNNDSDVEGDILSAELVDEVAHGTLTLNADGSFTYTPDANYYGPDSFTYKAKDGSDYSNVATVSITVNPVNDAPVLGSIGSQTVDEETTLTFIATATDVDNPADTLIFTLVGGPNGASITSDGHFSWTPTEAQGPDNYIFTIKVCDNGTPPLCDQEEITVSVKEVNVAPELGSIGNKEVNEGSLLSFTATATDYDFPANTLTFSLVGAPAGATINPTTGLFNWTPADNGSYPFTVKVCDNGVESLCDEEAITVTVANVAPSNVSANSPTIDENGTATLSGSFTDPGILDTHTVEINWGAGEGSVMLSLAAGETTFTASHQYMDDNPTGTVSDIYVIAIKVTDKEGDSGSGASSVTVNNVAPTVDAGEDDTIDEGGTFTGSGSFTDPGTKDTWTATVNYGDGSATQSLLLSGKTFNLSYMYADNGSYPVTVCVTDDDLGSGCDSLTVTVKNVAPVVDAGNDATINEGDTFSGSGSFTDPGADTWTATVDYGDGSAPQTLVLSGKNFNLSHTYVDNGIYTVTVKVTDDDAGSGSDSLIVTVNNVNPVATAGAVSGTEGSPVSENASFTDAGTADTHTCSINWGDATTTTGTVVESNGSGTCSGSHAYVDNGSYTVTVTVTDKDGGSDSDTATATIINANPIVSAPGWANTSVACRQSATLTGINFNDAGVVDYPWNININWGDSSTDTNYNANPPTGGQGVQPNQTHVYNTPGTYTVNVGVTDKDAGYGSNTAAQLTVYQTYTINFLQPFDGSSPSNLITNTMKSGRVVPVKVTIYDDCAQKFVTDPAALVRINVLAAGSTAANDAVEVYADAGASNSNTLYFRWTSDTSAPGGGFWIYNLDSKTALNGQPMVVNTTYKVDVYVGSVKATASKWALLKPVK